MEKLNNVNSVFTLNFNLREPKGNKTTNLYAVINFHGKQIKMPIDCKINPWQWDKKRQTPKFCNNMTNKDRKNALDVFNIIYECKLNFQSYYNYLCTNFKTATINEIMEKVIKRVRIKKSEDAEKAPKEKVVKATSALKKALEQYKTVNNITDSSFETYSKSLKVFSHYCEKINKDSVKMLTEEGLKQFEIHLKENGISTNRTITILQTIIRLINKEIIKKQKFSNLGIVEIKYDFPKKTHNENKKVALTEEEIEKIKNCKNLTDTQKEYKDLFLLAIYTGQRASDLHRLFDKSISVENGYFVFFNKKKKIETVVEQTPQVVEIIDRYKDGFKHIDIKHKDIGEHITNQLKKIAKQAHLDRTVTFTEDGVEKKKPLYEMISSHIGRHTFITEKLKSGMSAENLKYLSGHANVKTILRNYTHLTASDKIKIIENLNNKSNINDKTIYEKGKEDKTTELIDETKKVLVFLGANYLDIADINNLDELSRMIYTDYERKVLDLGIDYKLLKRLFNENSLTLKEKREKLQDLIEEILTKVKAD